MWILEEIDKFIKDHPIFTDGSLNRYTIEVEEKDDGDEWVAATLPFWDNNNAVVTGVLTFAQDALKQHPDTTSVHIRAKIGSYNTFVEVCFHTHFCDPD